MSAIKSSMKARVRHGVYSESEEEDSGEERLLQAKREVGFYLCCWWVGPYSKLNVLVKKFSNG